ncbi:MAG: amino acid--tRNA ligase-related protein [bacterium]
MVNVQQKTSQVRLEEAVFSAGLDYLKKEGFNWIPSVPRIVRATGACENIDTLFEVSVDKDRHWFGEENKKHCTYLAQTGQLYLEALVPVMGGVYCLGPSFRAEPKIDSRHLIEFVMIEIEFPGDFKRLLEYIEGFVHQIAQTLASLPKFAQEAMGLTTADVIRLGTCPPVFTKVTYDQAINELQALGESIKWGDDIKSDQEKMLVNYHGSQPLFITHYPDPNWDHGQEIEVEKFFNMLPDPANPGRVLSSDLILPFSGESVGSAARVHEHEVMVARLKNSRMFKRLEQKGGSLDDFAWYLGNIKDHGSVPHAGCGFGMARIIQWAKGLDSITDGLTFASNRGTVI